MTNEKFGIWKLGVGILALVLTLELNYDNR